MVSICYISTYLNHHNKPTCDALYELTNGNFYYGYGKLGTTPDFEVLSNLPDIYHLEGDMPTDTISNDIVTYSFKYSIDEQVLGYPLSKIHVSYAYDNTIYDIGLLKDGNQSGFMVKVEQSIQKAYSTPISMIFDDIEVSLYEQVSTRYEFLIHQQKDLQGAENTLLQIINEMDTVMKDEFVKTFKVIQENFEITFKELFKGGTAKLTLTDPSNVLETGIEIEACPPGKTLKSISLLSGGEKTFTAISLLFAILKSRSVPFAILDEVEAALDEVNVNAFGEYIRKLKDKTQFILITHKKKTMEYADILYGITMQESGVSKLVSVKLEELK